MPKAKERFISFQPLKFFIWSLMFTFSIAISQSVDGNSTETLIENEKRTELLELEDSLSEKDEINDRHREALEDLQKIFGIRIKSSNNSVRHKPPPQFMMELYNTIADPSGITRAGKNPYNAKIVRSFVERVTTWLPEIYLFDISGLEANESVIEAELHLFRKRSAFTDITSKIRRSPYYLIRVYQVLEGKSMQEPADVHRLLTVHYVSAYDSGWQVFNVKQAVLAWIAGAPNLGLMVKALTFFGDEASIEFTRRNDYPGKQPILVLFDDDGRIGEETAGDNIRGVPHYYTYNEDREAEDIENDYDNNDRSNVNEKHENIDSELGDDYESGSVVHRRKRQQRNEFQVPSTKTNEAVNGIINNEPNLEINYGTQLGNNLETELFKRYKRIGRKKSDKEIEKTSKQLFVRPIRSTKSGHSPRRIINPPDRSKFVTQKTTRTRAERVLSSMDIYERDLLREHIKKQSPKFTTENNKKKTEESEEEFVKNYKRKQRVRLPSRAAEGAEKGLFKREVDTEKADTTECMRHEFYVDFQDIGLSDWIIAPKGYSAFHCQGRCSDTLPAIHDHQPASSTNHATFRGIMYKMGLIGDLYLPCCVPTKLFTISILYFDDNENVVLKMYEDMIADRCGCR